MSDKVGRPCEICQEDSTLTPRVATVCDVHSRYAIKALKAERVTLLADIIALRRENERLKRETGWSPS